MLANSSSAAAMGALSVSASGNSNENLALNLLGAASTSAGALGAVENSAALLTTASLVNPGASDLLSGLGINHATLAYLNLLQQQQQQQQQQHQHQLAQYQAAAQRHFSAQQVSSISQRNYRVEKKRSYPCNFQWCVLCEKKVHSSKLPCHIRQCHVNKPMFQCPKCEFVSTYSKNNVKSHMVSLHNLAEEPISYMELYAGDVEEFMKVCFPNVRGRGRPIRSASRQSPESPSSTKSNESVESRRGSLSGIPTNTTTATNNSNNNNHNSNNNSSYNNNHTNNHNNDCGTSRFTHSHRRMSAKQAAQVSINTLLARACRKKARSGDDENNLGDTSSMNSVFEPPNSVDTTGGSASSLKIKSDQAIKMDNCVAACVKERDDSMTMTSAKRSPKIDANATSTPSLIATDQTVESNGHISGGRAEASRLGENMQPRYLKYNLSWEMLNEQQIVGTVFERLNSRSLIEKVELAPFEALLLSDESSLLTNQQLEKVDKVRIQTGLSTLDEISEVMRMIIKLDSSSLVVEQADLIASIAPNAIDAQRFDSYEFSNPVHSLSLSERLVIELAKIDRLEEKLHALSYMGHFNKRLNDLVRQLNDLDCAARLLHNSAEFHTLLQLVLTYSNFVLGDFSAQLVKGFRTSCLLDVCSFKLSTDPEMTLLSLIASTISNHLPAVGKFREHLPIIDRASKANFSSLSRSIKQLEHGFLRLFVEVNRCNDLASGVNDLVEHIERSLNDVKILYSSCKDAVISMLRFLAEPVNEEHSLEPETFFRTVAQFCRSLQRASLDLHL